MRVRNGRRPLLRLRRDDEGATAVIVVLSLVALLGVIVLTVDVGQLLFNRRAMVNASDAAALAAAQACAGLDDSDSPQAMADTFAVDNVGVAAGKIDRARRLRRARVRPRLRRVRDGAGSLLRRCPWLRRAGQRQHPGHRRLGPGERREPAADRHLHRERPGFMRESRRTCRRASRVTSGTTTPCSEAPPSDSSTCARKPIRCQHGWDVDSDAGCAADRRDVDEWVNGTWTGGPNRVNFPGPHLRLPSQRSQREHLAEHARTACRGRPDVPRQPVRGTGRQRRHGRRLRRHASQVQHRRVHHPPSGRGPGSISPSGTVPEERARSTRGSPCRRPHRTSTSMSKRPTAGARRTT